ncbi:uncharacterized protein PG998_007645 [Apiospora kogelbergensis]|uniref:SnoaL-like domain-containing protein n=1 Tax=Apiospora kogelbergensis TaxID=1337665 RepID=A0AAW0QCJ7_9PEZI
MISHSVQKSNTDNTKEAAADRSSVMRSRAHAFCQSLISPPSTTKLLSEFFIPDASGDGDSRPTIHEHGPAWASKTLPFLGESFTGGAACEEYFTVLADTLKMHMSAADSFPGPDGFVVDAARNQVCVVGKGRFESVKTGRSWDEQFTYVLSGWDGQGWKMRRWDIWADPLSAWAAVAEEDVDGWKKGEHRQ